VLAHEVAHISQNHLSRRIQERKKESLIHWWRVSAALIVALPVYVASGALMPLWELAFIML